MKKLFTLFICLTLVLFISSLAQGAVLEVKSPTGGIGTLGDVYTNIQAAIDDASPGDTIVVHKGLYTENIDISKWLILEGDGNGDNPAVDTIITAAVANHPTVQIQAGGASESERLIISNMRITGATGSGNPGSGIEFDIGSGDYITLENVASVGNGGSGVVTDVTGAMIDIRLINCNFSDNGNHGINVNSTDTIDGFTVTDCQMNGNGGGLGMYLEGPLTDVNISGGAYTGNGDGTWDDTGIYANHLNDGFATPKPIIIQNLDVSNNPRGLFLNVCGGPSLVIDNVTSNNNDTVNTYEIGAINVYSNMYSGACGSLGSLQIINSTANNAVNPGIMIKATDAVDSIIVDNVQLSGNKTGIYMRDYGGTITDATISDCNITNNLTAIQIVGTPTGVSIVNNDILNNGPETGILIEDGAAAGSEAHNNCIVGNGFGVNNLDTNDFDATLNAWGDPTGPYHMVKNSGGSGDEISDYVSFYPWYLDCTMTTTVSKRVHNITIGSHYDDIQPAIDEANPGDIIVADAGIYHENLAGWKDMEITKSLTLGGAGSGSTIVELSEGNGLGGKMNGVEIRGSNLDVTIEGMTFTKTPGNTYATSYPIRIAETASSFNSLTLRDVEVGYAEAANVMLGSSGNFTNITVEDCNFHHAGTWGFLGSGIVNGMVVSDSNFVYSGQVDPGHGVGFDLTGTSSTNVSVTGGNFSNNKQAGINLMRISNSSFTGCVANNNAGAGGGGFGIKLDEWGGKSQNITFEQCVATGNGLDGITIQPEKDDAIENILIDGCVLTDNGRNGVNLCYVYSGSNNPEMTDITISCCNLSGNGGKGVDVYSWWVPMTITETFDAKYNWWGDPSGPSGEGGGSGAAVSEHVDFYPWLLNIDGCGDYTVTAPDFVVDDNWVGLPDWTTVIVEDVNYYIGLNAFDDIQEAVDAAADGNNIYVYDGNYSPFTVDGKTDLTITAGSNPVVEGVQSVNTNYGPRDCVVFVNNSVNILLNMLDIRGNGLGTINPKNYGVIYQNSSGSIKASRVSPNTAGDMAGIAVGIWDGSVVSVLTTLIENYGRIGVFVYNGADAQILDNVIVGQVYADEGEVCYGIEVEAMSGTDDPATASSAVIKRNEIYNCDNTFEPEPSWGSDAILINGWKEYGVEAESVVTIVDNLIHDNYEGIYAIDSPSSRANFNSIYDNRTAGVASADAADDSNSVFDAKYNWWGDISGPNDPNGTVETDGGTICPAVEEIKNADGAGNKVTENVLYCPWLLAPISSSAYPCPAGDLDFDCDVDFVDLALFANNWLVGTEE